MSRLTRDGIAEPVSRNQFVRSERRQGNIHFVCSADHEQDWQPCPIDPYSCNMCDHTYITCMRPESHTQLPNNCLRLIVIIVFFFVGGVSFSEYFVPLPFHLYMESTSYVFPSLGGVFVPCDDGLDFLHEIM